MSLFVNRVEVANNLFIDPKLNGSKIFVAVEFEENDCSPIYYYGYDEFLPNDDQLNEPTSPLMKKIPKKEDS